MLTKGRLKTYGKTTVFVCRRLSETAAYRPKTDVHGTEKRRRPESERSDRDFFLPSTGGRRSRATERLSPPTGLHRRRRRWRGSPCRVSALWSRTRRACAAVPPAPGSRTSAARGRPRAPPRPPAVPPRSPPPRRPTASRTRAGPARRRPAAAPAPVRPGTPSCRPVVRLRAAGLSGTFYRPVARSATAAQWKKTSRPALGGRDGVSGWVGGEGGRDEKPTGRAAGRRSVNDIMSSSDFATTTARSAADENVYYVL